MKNQYIIDGNDLRSTRLVYLLSQIGEGVCVLGEESDNVENAVYVLFPRFAFDINSLERFAPNTTVFYFREPNEYIDYFEKRNIKLVNMSYDEKFAGANAFLTAEGILALAITGSDRALSEENILVLGFGRVGKAIITTFSNLTNITVATDNIEKQNLAPYFKIKAITIAEAWEKIATYSLIINTIPAPLWQEYDYSRLDPNTYILEVASPPYIFDYERIKSYSLHYTIAPALPSRYSKTTASDLIASRLLRYMEETK